MGWVSWPLLCILRMPMVRLMAPGCWPRYREKQSPAHSLEIHAGRPGRCRWGGRLLGSTRSPTSTLLCCFPLSSVLNMLVKKDFARTYFLNAFPRASAPREEPVPSMTLGCITAVGMPCLGPRYHLPCGTERGSRLFSWFPPHLTSQAGRCTPGTPCSGLQSPE